MRIAAGHQDRVRVEVESRPIARLTIKTIIGKVLELLSLINACKPWGSGAEKSGEGRMRANSTAQIGPCKDVPIYQHSIL